MKSGDPLGANSKKDSKEQIKPQIEKINRAKEFE